MYDHYDDITNLKLYCHAEFDLMCNIITRNIFMQIFLIRFVRYCGVLSELIVTNSALSGKTFLQVKQKKLFLQTMKQVFVGKGDRFGGVTVDSKTETCTGAELEEKLLASLNEWKEKNARGIWFKVFLEHSEWVPILTKNGFVFHHAKPEYVMMCRWLPETEANNIPRFAHTMIGVGAVVANSERQILVVREKYYADKPHWKLPGGYVEQGEDLADAAVREVMEETGISSQFRFLVAFRHTQGINFDCSDIYFIVCLKPLSNEIKMCEREIAACQWMKIEDFLKSSYVHETNKFFVQQYLKCLELGCSITYKCTTHPILKRVQALYNVSDEHMTSEKQATEDS
ncbi:uncharacterized protein LOC134534997 [Bacillus rossius redtenbacheri]|uniref:uncharacterized protein LOC134534997 n=1 Tax=Bacillus rossius redtenbacheri TaxID=93214 RepID=UPI002FDE60B0